MVFIYALRCQYAAVTLTTRVGLIADELTTGCVIRVDDVAARGAFRELLDYYRRLGVVLNEINRSVGLIDVVPEVFTTAVEVKLQYVHDLIRQAADSP
jgi:hypothetical protein